MNFDHRLREACSLHDHKDCSAKLGALLLEVLQGGDAAAAGELSSVLGGKRGDIAQEALFDLVVSGVDFAGDRRNFVAACCHYRAFGLLRTLARTELTPQLRQVNLPTFGGATTSAGVWLDVFSDSSFDVDALNGVGTNVRGTFMGTLALEVLDPEFNAGTELANLIAELDPTNLCIAQIRGTPQHAMVMEALMRQHVSPVATSSAASNQRKEAASSRRRGNV